MHVAMSESNVAPQTYRKRIIPQHEYYIVEGVFSAKHPPSPHFSGPTHRLPSEQLVYQQ